MTCPSGIEPFHATFRDAVSLVGFGLSRELQPGETLPVDLCWQATASSSADYTVFVHLLNEEGHLVAQADGQPLGGRYLLSIWEPGESVPDRHLIQLPADVSSGSYRLQVGFYDWMTGVRLPALSSQGTRQPDDSLPLTTVEVIPRE